LVLADFRPYTPTLNIRNLGKLPRVATCALRNRRRSPTATRRCAVAAKLLDETLEVAEAGVIDPIRGVRDKE